ncbi:MAG TPA: sortase [Candidatus Paceibacterota bacterium]|nr:sortase [Candidatus Paceibacterota bacterium]
MSAVNAAVRLVRAAQHAWAARFQFLVTFTGVLFVTLSVLIWLDWVPDAPAATTPVPTTLSELQSPDAVQAFVSLSGEDPVKITAPAIGLSATISNPTTTNVEALDQYLLTGAVRYPTSALLGQNGNMILFGHSSYLPIVHNQAYKTFDGIQNLKQGDLITVSSSGRAYTYSVDTVAQENVSTGAIPLTNDGKQHLTLATCDSFGTKSDRFVVMATLVESHALSN